MTDLNPPQNHQAKSILLWAMEHGGPPEKWVATQCLALSGVITDKVIGELVNHLHADNAVRTEKAGTLLAQLSQQSVSFPCDIVILIEYRTSDLSCLIFFALLTSLNIHSLAE